MTAPPVAEATQAVRASTGGSKASTFKFVRAHVDAYIESSNHYFTPKHRERFVRASVRAFEALLQDPHDKSWREDPTGETAIRNVIRAVARGR